MKISQEIKNFIIQYRWICVCTLGVAIMGYSIYALGGKTVSWIRESMGIAKKVNQVAVPQIKKENDLQREVMRPKENPLANPTRSSSEEWPVIKETSTQPVSTKLLSQSSPETSSANSLAKRAILYMSITGNPTHLGHMAAIATAIHALAKKGIAVKEAKISLSSEAYHKGKVKVAGNKKVALSQEAREYLLKGAITEAAKRNMFKGISVEYWNDKEEGFSDHPQSYRHLAKKSDGPVYLVAGFDLCQKMGNWSSSVENAVIISRDSTKEDKNKLPILPASYIRLFEKTIYPQYESLSSSAIQAKEAQLEPAELQEYFLKACQV